MDFFDGKVVIITGASEGIGAEVSAILRKRGAHLVLAARSENKLREAGGQGSLVVAGDLTLDSTRSALIARAIERWSRIDVLINNAGRGSYFSASNAPLEDARSLFELNFFAPLALAQLATPHLRETRGAIVNVSSIAGIIPLPWLPVYSASKFALTAITSSQRMELRRAGVHVMSVFPGYVDTDFQSHATGAPPTRVVRSRRFAVTVKECAEAIVTGIERRKRNVVTPAASWPLVWLSRVAPGFVESRLEAV